MMDDARLFRRTDPDFPTTRAVQQRLVAAGHVEGQGHRPSKMRESADIAQIAAALVRAQAALDSPPRNREVLVCTKTGGTYTLRYATLDNIMETIRAALGGNGLCVLQPIVSTQRGPVLVTRLLRESGRIRPARAVWA